MLNFLYEVKCGLSMVICFMTGLLLFFFPIFTMFFDVMPTSNAAMILYLIAVIVSFVMFLILLIFGFLIKDKTTRSNDIIVGISMLVYSLFIVAAGIVWLVFGISPFLFSLLVITMFILSVWYFVILFKPTLFQRRQYLN